MNTFRVDKLGISVSFASPKQITVCKTCRCIKDCLFPSEMTGGGKKKKKKEEEGRVEKEGQRSACERGRLFEISPPLWGPGKWMWHVQIWCFCCNYQKTPDEFFASHVCWFVYAWVCVEYGGRTLIWMCEHACGCTFMSEGCACVCVCICEQVAGIFEDDSRGLTHARPNKATLWWSLCDTLSLGLWGLSLPHTHVHNTHTLVHTVPRVSSGAPRQIVKAALWLLRVSVRPVCGLMMTHCTLSTNAIDPSRHLCTPVLGTATHISSCKRTTTYVCFEMFWMLLSLVKSSWITWSAVRHAKLENHNRIYTILMRTIIR